MLGHEGRRALQFQHADEFATATTPRQVEDAASEESTAAAVDTVPIKVEADDNIEDMPEPLQWNVAMVELESASH